jgi:hypothetical protein
VTRLEVSLRRVSNPHLVELALRRIRSKVLPSIERAYYYDAHQLLHVTTITKQATSLPLTTLHVVTKTRFINTEMLTPTIRQSAPSHVRDQSNVQLTWVYHNRLVSVMSANSPFTVSGNIVDDFRVALGADFSGLELCAWKNRSTQNLRSILCRTR